CTRDQFCSDDGLFGQCLSSKQDQVQYQVSVPVLKRMQEVLKQLMLQGLSWQDDITQYILSKELKRVPHTTHPSKSKQHVPHHHSSKSGSTPSAGNYVDYMIVEPPQSQLRCVSAAQVYARPSSRSQASQRERERDRQLLQEALSLYLASAQPSYRHRGAASMAPAGLPYYDDLELDIPMDYVEGYTLEERLGTAGRQQMLQNKKVPQDYSTLSGNNDGLLQRMSGVLQRYGVDPRELSQEQLYKLALILQLLQMQLLKTDSVSNKPQKPVPVPGPPDAPLAPSSASIPATPAAKSASPPPSATQPPQAAPAEAGQGLKEQGPPLVEGMGAKEEYGYIVTNQSPLGLYDGVKLLELLADKIHLTTSSFINISVVGPALTFRIRQNEHNMTAAEVAAKAVSEKNFLESQTGLKIVQTGVGERTDARGLPQVTRVSQGSSGTVITLVSMAVVGGVLVLAMAVACLRHYAQQVANGKLGLGPEGGAETHFDYQDCVATGAGGRRGTDTSRVSSVSSQFSDGPQHSPSSTHSSTPSWSEEPAQSNMDISTGHMILAYMEDHLRNKDRLQKEWEALCSYQAEPSSVAAAQVPSNMDKNRNAESLPYDHTRVKLKTELNPNKQDYINASIIFDHDPRQPAYIATQGPLSHTVADFWQMVWENGCTVIVMMSALVEDGEKQCERYWPDEGSSLYHIYEVNLVSEHIWCKDFLVRSFYLKNVQTQETRTLTQFHLLSWPADGIPTSTRPLLDFRRKVNKCYRGRSCPIIVHCSDGTSRTGTYILIDMVLNRMAKGVKEIDIAAALEHIRDQRPGLVRTKDQFEFALTAVAEEVNAILKALPQ
uniref:Protein tyrosine phosphatase receptor type Na n=1 Tax=Seriola dumerili TaxID=41447 RepID=A0A3B4URN9_SERDU